MSRTVSLSGAAPSSCAAVKWRFLISAISSLASAMSPVSAASARRRSWLVTPVMALTTTTTRVPWVVLRATRLAEWRMASALPIRVPPNFMTSR